MAGFFFPKMFKNSWFYCMSSIFLTSYFLYTHLECYLIAPDILFWDWHCLLNILAIIGQNILNLQCLISFYLNPVGITQYRYDWVFFHFSITLRCKIQLLQGEAFAIIFMKGILLQSPLQERKKLDHRFRNTTFTAQGCYLNSRTD